METSEAAALVEAALRGELSEAQALRLYRLGSEAVKLALLAASKRIGEQGALIAELQSLAIQHTSSPSTPSGMIPIYEKPTARKRPKKPGAKKGHPGARRSAPTRIDEHKSHRLKRCPHCEGQLQRCRRTRRRIIEDIPEDIQPLVTEHTIHRDYCPRCKKHVEPAVPDAMPGAALGHQVVGLTGWFHYGLGITIDQIVDILGYHLQTRLSQGGLIDAWRRMAIVLSAWYQQIADEARRVRLDAQSRPPTRSARLVRQAAPYLWCMTSGRRTNRSPSMIANTAWCICCANWRRLTNIMPAMNGGHSPSCFGG